MSLNTSPEIDDEFLGVLATEVQGVICDRAESETNSRHTVSEDDRSIIAVSSE